MPIWAKYLLNASLYQAGWFICITQGNLGAIICLIIVLGFHFSLMVPAEKRLEELRFIIIAMILGCMLEAVFLATGVLTQSNGDFFPPLWLAIVWLLFATIINYALGWLKSRLWLASLLAFISAPGSYYLGARLSETMSFTDNVPLGLLVIGLGWAIILPVLFRYPFLRWRSVTFS